MALCGVGFLTVVRGVCVENGSPGIAGTHGKNQSLLNMAVATVDAAG